MTSARRVSRYGKAAFRKKSSNVWAGTMTSHAAAGQLQQRPTAREGGVFKREWFNNPVKRVPYDHLNLVRAWDLASTSDPSNDPDYTVGLLMGRDRDTNILYIIDVIRGRFSPGEREQKIISTAILDGTSCTIRIPQDPGGAGKFEAHHLAGLLQGCQGLDRTRRRFERKSRRSVRGAVRARLRQDGRCTMESSLRRGALRLPQWCT